MRRGILALVLLAASLAPASPANAGDLLSVDAIPGTQSAPVALWRVFFNNGHQLNRLAREIDIWEVDHTQKFVVALLSEQQQAALTADGFRTEPHDRRFDLLHPTQTGASQWPSDSDFTRTDTISGLSCYRTVEKTYADLEALALRHPNLATWIDIGDSWERVQKGPTAGYDIGALILTNNELDIPKFRFLVAGAVHAREMVTAEAAARFAERLVTQYGADPDITWLLDYGEVHIIPVVNPDGRKLAEKGYYWRKNTNNSDGCGSANPLGPCYGVDLNRNSNFQWGGCTDGGCSSGDSCAITYRGSSPASEPETRALQAYAQTIFADQRGPNLLDAAPDSAQGLFVTLHSYGQLVMFPWGWSGAPSPNDVEMRALARKLAEPLGYRSCQAGEWGCLYQTDGTNDDWMYGELGVAAFTFELGSQFFQSCSSFEETILPNVAEALTIAFKSARRPYVLAEAREISSLSFSPARITAGTPVTASVTVTPAASESAHAGDASLLLRYSTDTPSWIPGAVVVTITQSITESVSAPGVLHATINTTGFLPGRRLLFMEAANVQGATGSPRAAWLDVVEHSIGWETTPASIDASGSPGTSVAYAVTVMNTGSLSDTLRVSVVDATWPVELEAESLSLPPGEQGVITVRVMVPNNTKPGEADVVRIRLISITDSTVTQNVRLRTSARPYTVYYPFVSASKSALPEPRDIQLATP